MERKNKKENQIPYRKLKRTSDGGTNILGRLATRRDWPSTSELGSIHGIDHDRLVIPRSDPLLVRLRKGFGGRSRAVRVILQSDEVSG